MKTSVNGKALIRHLEGFAPEVYVLNGVPHIGYGFNLNYHNPPQPITEPQAREFMDQILPQYEYHVNNINTSLNQNQYDALVSFAYQRGHIPNALKTLLHAGDYTGAAGYIRSNLFGAPASRRQQEAELFEKPYLRPYLLVLALLLVAAGGYVYSRKKRKK